MNEWGEWETVKGNYYLLVCPKCKEPLKCYMDEWREFLVCSKCEYARCETR